MAKASFNELINADKPVLVDFFAEWCGPCKTMAPVLEQIAQNWGDKIKVIKIDTDKNTEVSRQYGVQGIPTFLLFKSGKQLWRASGAIPAHQLQNILKQHLG